MKIVFELNERKAPVSEFYEDMAVISVLADVCEAIDENNLASFAIYLANGEKLAPEMDFMYDFLSIMPELLDMQEFLGKDNSNCFKLYLYELDIIIQLDIINTEYLYLSVYKSHRNPIKIAEYQILRQELSINVEEVLYKFKKLIANFFPMAYSLFVKENYLDFAE